MAMKVSKTTVHRLTVTVSCGCRLFCEYEDAQCKKPVSPIATDDESAEPEAEKIFTACAKHVEDPALGMLKFVIEERLDEAVEAARKAPAVSVPRADISDGDTGGVMVVGGTAQRMGVTNMPVRKKTDDPTQIKTLQRSAAQLKKAGAATHGDVGVEIGEGALMPDEVEVDPRLAAVADNVLVAVLGDEEDPLDGIEPKV